MYFFDSVIYRFYICTQFYINNILILLCVKKKFYCYICIVLIINNAFLCVICNYFFIQNKCYNLKINFWIKEMRCKKKECKKVALVHRTDPVLIRGVFFLWNNIGMSGSLRGKVELHIVFCYQPDISFLMVTGSCRTGAWFDMVKKQMPANVDAKATQFRLIFL